MPKKQKQAEVDPQTDPFLAGLRHLAARSDRNQKWLAQKIGKQQSTVSDIMRGITRPLRTMEAMARAYDSTYEEVIRIGSQILRGSIQTASAGSDQGGGMTELHIYIAKLELRIEQLERRISDLENTKSPHKGPHRIS